MTRPIAPTAGVHHIGLTVPNLASAQNFFEEALRFDRRKNIGLHHLALRVSEETDIDELHRSLDRRGDVVIEFAPEALGDGPTRHMMCSIPGNIRLELIAPVAA